MDLPPVRNCRERLMRAYLISARCCYGKRDQPPQPNAMLLWLTKACRFFDDEYTGQVSSEKGFLDDKFGLSQAFDN